MKKRDPNHKRRREFVGYINRTPVVKGVLYDQGNVQVLWRSDIGWTGEQYQTIANVFGIMSGMNKLEIEDV